MEIVIKGLVPLSYNSRHKTSYQEMIRAAVSRKYNGKVPLFPKNEELYAKVYFFTSEGINVDGDNISKPIWDALGGLVFADDRNIVMRTAAIIDVNIHPINIIDTDLMESSAAADLMQELASSEVKCLYIECGEFNESMIKIGETNI